jgi:hypothetical protein
MLQKLVAVYIGGNQRKKAPIDIRAGFKFKYEKKKTTREYYHAFFEGALPLYSPT